MTTDSRLVGKLVCTKCGLERLRSEFHRDKSHKTGLTSDCKYCWNKYNKAYYKGNTETIIEAVISRRKGKPSPKTNTVKSINVNVRFLPDETRRIIAAFVKQYGREPKPDELSDYVTRYSLAGVRGQVQFILKDKYEYK
jgi:hypothetical protein